MDEKMKGFPFGMPDAGTPKDGFPFGGMPPKGMPPMGMKPPHGDHPPMGWMPPRANIDWVKRKYLDVAYDTTSAAQTLDIYLPENGEGPFPALVHIHGGGFALGDKRDDHMDAYLKGLHEGFVVCSIEYRLSGESRFPAAVLDVRQAIRFLREHAVEYKIDPKRIAAIGGSAGGNLTAILAMNIPNGRFKGETGSFKTEPFVQAAVDQFGPTDFKRMDEQARANGVSFVNHDEPRSAESEYIGEPIGTASEETCEKANPSFYVSDAMCPILIQHGRMDKLVPFQQSESLYQAICDKLGHGKAIFMPFDTADHEDRQFFTDENLSIIWAFLKEKLA